MAASVLVSTLIFAAAVSAQRGSRSVSSWGQCGGSGYNGPTACPTNMVCTVGNPWYSQCVEPKGTPDQPIPGVPDSPIPVETTSFQTVITITPTATFNQPTVVTTYITFLTPGPTTAAPDPSTGGPNFGGSSITLTPDSPVTAKARWVEPEAAQATEPAAKKEKKKARRAAVAAAAAAAVDVEERSQQQQRAAGPELSDAERAKRGIADQQLMNGTPTPTTLKTGQYWIRAVASPHFHEYLQTTPQNDPGTALLGNYKSAGQYNIVGGQLVSAGSETPYYLHVEKPTDLTQRKLAVWFNTTKNEYGTFTFSGDALTWSVPEIKRQNLAAWLCCEKNALFINTGAYAYQTPAGCADQTIHYYNGATANL